MNRIVRLASLLRWTTVAMHTAIVVSTGTVLTTAGDPRMERMAAGRIGYVCPQNGIAAFHVRRWGSLPRASRCLSYSVTF